MALATAPRNRPLSPRDFPIREHFASNIGVECILTSMIIEFIVSLSSRNAAHA